MNDIFSDQSPAGIYIAFIVALVVLIGVFLLLRALVLWYYQINKRVMLLEDIKAYTMFIAKNQFPEKFREFDQLYNTFKKSQVGKVEDPRN